MSNQKKKNLGQGMKPRGNPPIPEIPENAVSADTGQEEASVDLIPRVQEGEQTPNNLEPEIEHVLGEPFVASHDPHSTYVMGVDLAAGSEESLSRIMEESGDPPEQMQRTDEYPEGGQVIELSKPGHPIPVISVEVTKMTQREAEVTLLVDEAASGGYDVRANEFPTAEDIANYPLIRLIRHGVFVEGEGSFSVVAGNLGQQSDGTFKLVLSVDEGYIESIRQEAENGGMTPEQWCSQQFNFFLESWWSKPKGR